MLKSFGDCEEETLAQIRTAAMATGEAKEYPIHPDVETFDAQQLPPLVLSSKA